LGERALKGERDSSTKQEGDERPQDWAEKE